MALDWICLSQKKTSLLHLLIESPHKTFLYIHTYSHYEM